MSNIDDLQRETKTLPVKTHTYMLAKQLLAGCHQSHRSDYQTTQNPIERLIKPWRRTTYGVQNQHLDEGLVSRKNYRKAQKVILHEFGKYLNPWKLLERLPPHIFECI